MADDDLFGPHLPGLFDFTLLFEQSILSLLPTALFILLTPLRIFPLCKATDRVKSGALLWMKCAATAVYGLLQIVLVALWASLDSTPKTKLSIVEPAIAVVEAVAIGFLSYLEHVKSPKPSVLLNGYLVLSTILDIALTRTLWIRKQNHITAAIFTVALAWKFGLLILEEVPKKPLSTDEKQFSRETRSGVISRSLFWWLNSLFYRGAHGLLTLEGLDDINEKFASEKLFPPLVRRWKAYPKEKPAALLRCTFSAFKLQFAAGIFPRLLNSGFTYAQPFLIRAIIVHVATPEDQWSLQIASGLIGATLLVYVGCAVSKAWYKHTSFQLVTMYRGGLVSLIYNKTLSVKVSSIRENAPVTLMSTDMDIIAGAAEQLHDVWASLIELPIGIYILYEQISFPSLFVLIPTFVTTIFSGLIALGMEPATVAWNAAIQARIGQVTNMLGQMKGIKMMGLTMYFHNLVHSLRIDEIKASERLRRLSVYLIALATTAQEMTPMIIILAAIYWTKAEDGLSITEAFTSLSIISLATMPLIVMLSALTQIAGVFGSFGRIQTFLLIDEQEDSRSTAESLKRVGSVKTDKQSLSGSVGDDVRDSVATGELQLSELRSKLRTGAGSIPAAVSICRATFKGNDDISLLQDISLDIQHQSITMIISRVGGGKSSLLRAILGELSPSDGSITTSAESMAFCDQTPWLQNTSIRRNIIGQSLLEEEWLSAVIKACLLDHDLASFPAGDATVVGSQGVALSGGQKQRVALARAVYSRKDIIILDDVFSGLDNKTSRKVFRCLLGADGILRQGKSTVILSTSNPNFLSAADNITVLDSGRIVRNQVTYQSLEPSDWGVLADETDADATHPGDVELIKQRVRVSETGEPVPQEGDLLRQTGDTECYKIFLRSMGWGFVFLMLLLIVCSVGLEIVPRIWLRFWTESNGGSKDPGYTGGYVAFVMSSVITGGFSLGFFIMVGLPRSASNLHEQLLSTVCRAPLYFFTTTDSGITLNRFSQDMTLVDLPLPLAFYMTAMLVLRAIAQTGVVASGASYVGIAIPALVVALYFVQKYYLRTSRQMRFLDIEAKAPLYTHFTETLAGISTVRSFGWSQAFFDENTRRLDTSQKSYYTMFCIQRWLQIVLDLFVAGLALVLVTIAVRVRGATSQGSIALALVSLLDFSQTLTLVIDQWTQLETSLGAIARLKWFANNTANENRPEENEALPSDWPARGEIRFDNVSASYSAATDSVVQNINLKVQAGQKVCICGRSGSGKSSLVLSLLRLLELRSGTIRIDGVDLSTVPRHQIRSQLAAVPQDPVTITGSIRENLDPEHEVQSDHLLIDVLRKAAIWPIIESRGGLDAIYADLGLSSGQQQLVCMARALLSRSKIVILDEATSSLDRETDEEIRSTLLQEFEGKTVIEIAHRLDVVKSYDIVIVMSEGEILEMGRPEDLLGSQSELRSLWESRGL